MRPAPSHAYAFRSGRSSLLSIEYTDINGGHSKNGKRTGNHVMSIAYIYLATSLPAPKLLPGSLGPSVPAHSNLAKPQFRFTHSLELPSEAAMKDSERGAGTRGDAAMMAWKQQHSWLPYAPRFAAAAVAQRQSERSG